jgi:hypothetical protein
MSILTEIGLTPEPIVEVITISVPGSGIFTGTPNYPAQSLDTALKAVIQDFEVIQDTVSNSLVRLPCAETILESYAVKLNSANQLEKCSAFDINHINSLIGLAKQTGNLNELITVNKSDLITNSTWSWTPNKPVFLGLNGTLTQAPIGVAFLQQVGIAITATQLLIRILQPFKRI